MDDFPFEIAWYILNLVGFRKLEYYHESIMTTEGPEQRYVVKNYRWKKHQAGQMAGFNVRGLFTDEHGYRFSKKRTPLRDTAIPITGPEICKRCGRTEKLERDHIIPLHLGGKDETANLQYLCQVCHKVKTIEDKINNTLRKFSDSQFGWRYRMWKYRQEAHERLNPVGSTEYHSYWEDSKTHYDHWASVAKKEKAVEAGTPTVKLDKFVDEDS